MSVALEACVNRRLAMVLVGTVGILGTSANAWSQTISYGPIIGRGITPDKMIVKWGTGTAGDPGSVSYRPKGSAAAFSTVSASTDKDHEVVLSGLGVDAQYEYYVQSGTAKSATYAFGTCPAAGSPMDVVFYGDSRSVPAEHEKIIQQVIAKNPEMVFESGDIVPLGNYGGTGLFASGYLGEFFPKAQGLVATTPFMAAPGNHDATSTLSSNYGLVFPMPRNAGEAWRSYYAFPCGNSLFVSLDSNMPTDATQLKFLKDTLAAATANAAIVNVFVWFHHSPYSVGSGHGDDANVQAQWVPVFEAAGSKVKMVFTGHDHIYAHMQHGTSPIAYVVSGGAGADLYDVTKASAGTTVKSAKAYNFVVVHIAGAALGVTAYDDTGLPLDNFSLGNTTPPPPPVDMAMSPIVDMSVPAADAGSPATADLSVGSDGGGTPPSTGGCAVGGSDSLPTGIFVVGAMLVLFVRRRRDRLAR
jgi:MYXO-CTERM domain-containing protein